MISLASLLPWLGTLWGRVAVAGLIASMWFGWLWAHDAKVESRIVQKIERASQVNVEKASAARRSVDSIPLDKLNDRYRRD